MGAKTFQRLVLLITALVIGGVSIFFFQRYQVTRMSRSIVGQAESAEKEGDFAKAERLYMEHLEVVPDDISAQQQYADVLLKAGKTVARQAQVVTLYTQILDREPGREDVRRHLAELLLEMNNYQEAKTHLAILIRSSQQTKPDGDLHYMMGQCQENSGDSQSDSEDAADSYKNAIAYGGSERLNAYQRRATILRGKLNKPEEADREINAMVASDPDNYRVYFERGRYRQNCGLPSTDDYQKALALAPAEPQIYLELAKAAQAASNMEGARQILEKGLQAAPKAPSLHEAIATLDISTGRIDEAISRLNNSLLLIPDNVSLRWLLASLLAERGNTGDLMLQIEELRKVNYYNVLITYLEAHYLVNANEWAKARQTLVKLQTEVESVPGLKARVNNLLARCHAHLGDPERQWEALNRAAMADPQFLPAKLELVQGMISRGEIDQAIAEYRKLLPQVPQLRLDLARLLTARLQQQPAGQQNWDEVESLVSAAMSAAPDAPEPLVARAELLLARGKPADAEALLEKERVRSPKVAQYWVSLAELDSRQKRFATALSRLDDAQKVLGDLVDLRVERARILVARGGEDVNKRLMSLAENLGSFKPEDRKRLLEILAVELGRQSDLAQAARLWSELATYDPNNLDIRLRLFDIAYQGREAKDEEAIKKALDEIARIDGADGNSTRYLQARLLIWKAQIIKDPAQQKQFRSEARTLLAELGARRPDWSVLPVALAVLDEQELVGEQQGLSSMQKELAGIQGDDARKSDIQKAISTKEQDITRKHGELANLYLQGIELGQRNLAIVRRAMENLVAAGRAAEVSTLWKRLPSSSPASLALQRMASKIAADARDYGQALDLARATVQKSPRSFPERLWLVQLLIINGRQAEAEAELRKAIDLDRTQPDPWIALVQFLIQTTQLDKAEKVVAEAETALPKDKMPLTLAICSEALGSSYDASNRADQKTRWYDAAKNWFKDAQTAGPNDPVVLRRYMEFLLRTEQFGEMEQQLTEILKRTPEAKNVEEQAWSRRILALTLAASNDYQKVRRALAVAEPIARARAGAGVAGALAPKPEDLRTLARVYEAQKDLASRKQCREILEELTRGNQANPEDRLLLARLHSSLGDWAKAREQYLMLIQQTKNPESPTVAARRPVYLISFASGLLADHETANRPQELNEAEELIAELKKLQPDSLILVELEARLLKARNRIDKAVELIQAIADRPNLPSVSLKGIARVAEALGQFDLATTLYRKLASQSSDLVERLSLAGLLGRQGRTKEALDICEPFWAATSKPDLMVGISFEILYAPGIKPDPVQVERVVGWIEKAMQTNPNASVLMIGLGNLRERQGRYSEAEALYRRVLEQGGADVIPLNNLAWLMALRNGNGATALELINRAIALRGPLPEFLDTRGVVYDVAGESQRAIEDLENAVAFDPSSATKHYHLAHAYLQANNRAAAKDNLAKARKNGLTEATLHPLEVATYRELAVKLDGQ